MSNSFFFSALAFASSINIQRYAIYSFFALVDVVDFLCALKFFRYSLRLIDSNDAIFLFVCSNFNVIFSLKTILPPKLMKHYRKVHGFREKLFRLFSATLLLSNEKWYN